MSNEPFHNDPSFVLTPEIMADYAQGNLSFKDQHFIERYLLDHLFEAAAMEGVELHPQAFVADLEKMSVKKTKVIPLWRQSLRLAAAVAILLLGSALILYLPDWSQPDAIVMKKVEESAMKSEKKKESTKSIEADENTNTEATKKETPDVAPTIKKSAPKLIKTKPTQHRKPIPKIPHNNTSSNASTLSSISKQDKIINQPEEENLVLVEPLESIELETIEVSSKRTKDSQKGDASNISLNESINNEENTDSKLVGQVAGMSSARRAKKIKETQVEEHSNFLSPTVIGQITSSEGEPIPGASIIIEGTSSGTVTDIDGNFEIAQPKESSSIIVSFIGYVTAEIEYGGQTELAIALEEDMQSLSEVVVTGYARASLTPINQSAQPENGFSSLKRYFKKEMVYPENAQTNNIEGKVTVSFTVDKYGGLSDFEIIKGLGYGCDEEALRLIQEGPYWNPAIKDNLESEEKITLKIKFKK